VLSSATFSASIVVWLAASCTIIRAKATSVPTARKIDNHISGTEFVLCVSHRKNHKQDGSTDSDLAFGSEQLINLRGSNEDKSSGTSADFWRGIPTGPCRPHNF
jgi:hypothetical protein